MSKPPTQGPPAGTTGRGTRRPVQVHRLGRVPYAPTHRLQERLVKARQAGTIPDTLLLLEHDPVITLGRGAKAAHLLRSRDELDRLGVELHETGRGGDVTYHGPGQLVAYPILDLSPDRRDVRRYVGDLERWMIGTVARFGVDAGRVEGLNGAWVEGTRKIGAVGVRISRWVTMHGIALNVHPHMPHFGLIVPCGIADRGVTSLSAEMDGRPRPGLEEVMDAAVATFLDVFSAELRSDRAGPPELPPPSPGATHAAPSEPS
ncbi:MAG TPA: lipoyl(octanoyl) transferase LipB [Polyangiaceae bacterium LLY-WYZ-14_1]|nr:lipoyl(octanoyl) transferase LipB [Polyangiaceae bacterium LLY-WYZ-14_1]